ncbi:hypothetical protein [Leisingera sp. F5]|uniref:hypothetical protein n=1 Tax=Leisingera sp. F5 TaxID=1813816 RepID=UPI000A8F7CA7|nr:hypothetical protein [Leisingera sp. F5]
MIINTSIGDHTLALFGAKTKNTETQLLLPNSTAVQDTAFAPPSAPVAAAPQQDAPSSFRPAETSSLSGTYADPRTTTAGQAAERAAPTYEGPSYSERAGGDLLGQVMKDMEAIRSNQLASLQEEFNTLVENAIGRELAEGEDAFDHFGAISNINTDRSGALLAGKVQGLEGAIFQVTAATKDEPFEIRSGLSLDGRTEEERIELMLSRLARGDLQSINASIRVANEAIATGHGEETDYLPPFSEEETEALRTQLLEMRREQYENGSLILTFE